MQLRFVRGDAQTPRGHAIVIARPYGQPDRTLATYCIVLPIPFSLARYLPPILTAQMPMEGMGELTNSPSVMPVPPMLEDVADIDALMSLAELRADDVIELEGSDFSNDTRRMELAAEASAEYGRLYESYTSSRQKSVRPREPIGFRSTARDETPAPPSNEIDALMNEGTPVQDRDQLGEVSRLIGTLRYGLEGNDQRGIDETTRALRRALAPLSEKYHPEDLINAAVTPGSAGQKLADLYLMRAYKLADEDYAAIPTIEEQIQQAKGE